MVKLQSLSCSLLRATGSRKVLDSGLLFHECGFASGLEIFVGFLDSWTCLTRSHEALLFVPIRTL